MKIPKTFVPEKDLDGKVKDLYSAKPCKIKSLKDLILQQDSESFRGFCEMQDHTLESYHLLDSSLVEERVVVDYKGKIYVHMMRFFDEESLKSNLKGVVAIVNSYNQSGLAHCNAFFRDEYLVFVYSSLGDKEDSLRFSETYKKLGFKEV